MSNRGRVIADGPGERAAPSAAGPHASTHWPAVLALILSGMLTAAQIGKVPPALPLLRHDLGLSLVVAGWVASLFSITAASFGIISGAIADRLGRRRVLLSGLGALALGSLLGALSHSGAALLISRAIEGVGFVAVVVSAPALITEAAPAQHRLTLSMWSSYMPTGFAAMLLLTPLALDSIGWRGLWLCSALVLLAFLPVCAYLIRPRDAGVVARNPGLRPGLADFRDALARPGPWALGLCFAAYTLQWSAIMAWLPTFIISTTRLPLASAILLTAAVVFANMPGTQFGGWLLGRGVKRWRLLAAAPLFMGLSEIGIFVLPLPDEAKYLLTIAFSFLGGMLPAACLSGVAVHSRRPQEIGLVTGMQVQGANIGSLLGPPMIAALVAAFGSFDRAGLALPVAAAVGIGLALCIRIVEQRQ